MVQTPSAVLDTNVVLDWLLFADAAVLPLARALESGGLCWLASPSMRAELEATLAKPTLARWHPDSERLLARFDAHAVLVPEPPTSQAMRCNDPDDQVFIDLALHAGALWLCSHDRAVLRLRRQAAASGLRIVKPGDWQAA